jgi:hypothetical protein
MIIEFSILSILTPNNSKSLSVGEIVQSRFRHDSIEKYECDEYGDIGS